MRRNARRAINYNLPGKLPQIAGETFAQALNRGSALIAAQETEAQALEERRKAALEPYVDGIQMDQDTEGEHFTIDMTAGG